MSVAPRKPAHYGVVRLHCLRCSGMPGVTSIRVSSWRQALPDVRLSDDRRNLLVVGTIGFLLRAVLIAAYQPVLRPDSSSYLELARRLGSLHLAGNNGARTPGYPLLLLAAGYSPTAAWYLQAGLGVITTLLVYRIVRGIGGSSPVALAASLVYTTSIEVLAVEHYVLTEALETFLVTAAAAISVELVTTTSRRRTLAGLLGIVLAFSCLVRPEAFVVAIALVACILVIEYARTRPSGRRSGGRQRRLAALGLLVLAPPIIALAGWAAVNRATAHVTSVTTVTGMNMIDHVGPYVSVEPGSNSRITQEYVAWRRQREARYGTYFGTSWAASQDMVKVSHLDLAHLSIRLQTIAWTVMANHPLGYLWLSVKGWPHFWDPPNPVGLRGGAGSAVTRGFWNVERVVQLLLNATFLALCAADGARRLRRRPPILNSATALLAVVVLAGSLPVLFLGTGDAPRHGYVYVPLVIAVTLAAGATIIGALRIRPIPASS